MKRQDYLHSYIFSFVSVCIVATFIVSSYLYLSGLSSFFCQSAALFLLFHVLRPSASFSICFVLFCFVLFCFVLFCLALICFRVVVLYFILFSFHPASSSWIPVRNGFNPHSCLQWHWLFKMPLPMANESLTLNVLLISFGV